jgi:phage shock protein E
MMPSYIGYLVLALIVGFFIRRKMRLRAVKRKLPDYIKSGAVVIDVRSPAEYIMGHFAGSLNIPLQELPEKASNLAKDKTILLCCASGTRSGMAVATLKAKGFKNVINAGSWNNLILSREKKS